MLPPQNLGTRALVQRAPSRYVAMSAPTILVSPKRVIVEKGFGKPTDRKDGLPGPVDYLSLGADDYTSAAMATISPPILSPGKNAADHLILRPVVESGEADAYGHRKLGGIGQ